MVERTEQEDDVKGLISIAREVHCVALHQINFVIEEQSRGMVELYGTECAFRHGRKIFHDYLKGRGFHGSLRAVASATSCEADLKVWLDMAAESGVMPK